VVDVGSVDLQVLLEDLQVLLSYGTPIVGAALILGGIFLRFLGKGLFYLVLAVGIAGTLYVALRGLGTTNDMRLVGAVFLAGFAASATLALALRALTAAIEFGFFTAGWYLLLQAVPAVGPSFASVPPITGASIWLGFSIGTTVLAELLMRRLRRTGRFLVPAVAPIASSVRGVRR